MRASLWPIVFTFLSPLNAIPKPSNLFDGETRTDAASAELVTADHTLYNKQSIENYTFHGKAMDYIKYEGTDFRATEKNVSVDVRRTRTKRDGDEVGTALTCEEVLEEQGMSRRVRTFRCENAASFYKWEAQLEGQPVAVRVSQVNGGLTLPPNANVSLIALFLQETNLTHFINHTQDLSTLEELNLSSNPDFDAASLLRLGKLPSLAKLELAGTALATLNWRLEQVLKEMPALHYLNASSSNLHQLPLNTFQQNTKLQRLYINGNEFINLTLDQGLIQQLTHLNISGCSMGKLEVESRSIEVVHTHLHSIDLSHNHLTSLPASFMDIISNSLAHLNVADNPWKKSCTLCSLYHLWSYTDKHPDLVHGSQNLDCFRPKEALKMCGWEECPATCTCDSESKTVDCSATDLKTIPLLGPSDAEILLLENNNLLNMSGIESPVWCKLKTVIANNNRITSVIPPDMVGHCTCFDHDDLYEKDENCLPQSLQKLSLNHNKIRKLSQSDCQLLYSLRELHLSGNKVKHLGSSVCSSIELLEVLSLNNNSYSDLEEQDVAPYPNLRELNLSFNKLSTLPYRIIELMPKLTVLDVSHNKLRELSGETSTPDTPFTFMVPISLEELDLSYNNLEVIKPVLSLKHIPTLKKLSIHNNPWECSCGSILDLVDRVFKGTKHTAMVDAVRTLRCQKPPSLKGVLINSKVLQSCQVTEHEKGFFMIMVGILIVICLVVLVFHVTCQKITPSFNDMLGWPPAGIDATFRRRYSVFVVHSDQDHEIVKADLVDPLNNRGYSVAWHENAFIPGDNIHESIEKAVTTSRRMLVVASANFTTYQIGKQIIQRGLREEYNVAGFKVVALLMDDLPKPMYNVLREIVEKRTHVSRKNRNYIKKICNFLPAPVPIQRIITFTETGLYNFLWQQMEIIRKRENQRENHQRPHLQEVFPVQNLDPRGSSVGTSNAPQSENEIVTSMTDDIWEAVLSRAHEMPVPVSGSEQPHTFSYHYSPKENSEGEEELAHIEGFSRQNTERHSTKF